MPVDHDGNALMNCILWMDMRARLFEQEDAGLVNVAGADVFKLLRWIRLTGDALPTGKTRPYMLLRATFRKTRAPTSS